MASISFIGKGKACARQSACAPNPGGDRGSDWIVADSPERVDRARSETPVHRDYAMPAFRG
ncbi:hypothetical protein DI458_37295 [Burkholderia contaminans]|jgi:hypothetical protein|nr:hypothetical protein [Burkholderia contaminans]MBA9930500.1 hypothetical protein [Burkholderia contaminans]MCB4330784.1 hypothetical protein [Burkholderia contaminans]RBQ57362.1 hypothetical protein DI458_37295 [Burkholderia contaminans]RDS98997.1 hypothetical protein DWU95_38330 [Burkholderia contaminans]